MNKIRAIIVDDEEAARNVLQSIIELAHPEVEVLTTCENLPEAVVNIRQYKPDLVFLDVEMPEYAGYEIVKFFDKIDFQIIFVTAYNQYAIKAFEVNAADYLLKPVERKRLAMAIEKIKWNLQKDKEIIDYKKILAEFKSDNSRQLTISETGGKRFINTKDIIAIQAQGAYSRIFLKGNEHHTVSKNLRQLEDQLLHLGNFFRSHKSWLINLNELIKIDNSKESITLSEEVVCKLSRFKKSELDHAISNS